MLDRFLKREGAVPDPAGDVPRAVCALLVATARVDGSFAPDEARAIARLTSRHFALSPEDTAELLASTADQRQLDLFPVARWLKENLSTAQRAEVLELMWRVVFSDGKLEAHEDALMHRTAKILDVAHRDLIAAKLAARRKVDGA